MLNFKNTSWLFALTLAILIVFASLRVIHPINIFFVVFIYTLILAIGSAFIDLNFYFKSITKLKNPKAVLLSFDDGPNPEITPQILRILEEYDRKAIFFLIGSKAEKYPELVKQICENGHVIGNHTYSHDKFFDLQSSKKMTNEIKRTSEVLKNICGKNIHYFRPPFGVSNPNLKKAIKKSNLVSLAWSFRSFDTGKQSAAQISSRIKKEIKGGDILLFHDDRIKSLEVLKLSMPFLSNFEQGEINEEFFN